MMTKRFVGLTAAVFRPLACGLGLLALAGCSFLPETKPDPTRYYVFTGPTLTTDGVQRPAGDLRIGLSRVEAVPYLNGKAMIVRNASNEIIYEEYARWAEPLTTGISRIVTARLLASDKVGRVYPQPFPFDAERNYDLRLNVLRCEGVRKADGTTTVGFACALELSEAKPSGAIVLRKVFVAPESSWDGKDFGRLAQLLSDGVEALSEDVLAALPAK